MPKRKQGVQDIKAYFRRYRATERREQERQADDGDGEDEVQDPVHEEDTMEDFLELEEDIAVGNGAPYARARSVPLRERIMILQTGGKEIKVKGKFLMDGPWWIASFRAVEEGGVYICQGTPTYTLRYKKGQKGKSLLQQLLSYVFNFPRPGSAEDQMKQAFWDYFEKWRTRSNKKPKNYTFCQFFAALEDALKKETKPDDTSEIPMMQVAKVIMQRFDPSNKCFRHASSNKDEEEKKPKFDLRYVYRCFKCPLLFKGLPLLMEKQAFSILSTEKLRHLERLESVLKNSPEDLGFYTSMREHNWGTIEVSFQGFVNAGMIPPNIFKCTTNQNSAPPPLSKSSGKQNCTPDQPSTSTANQDTDDPSSSKKILSVEMAKVLKLYDIVKSRCKEGKHTFLYKRDMETAWRRDACENVPFGHIREEPFVELQERRVVKIEEKTSQSDVRFHWSKYRRYEKIIARSIETLLDQHEANPWTLPVADFSEFKFDTHQQGAALHVCKNALTVILGRGGCGKTHVVASIVRKYLDHLQENRRLTKIKEPSKKMQDGERAVCSEDTKEEKEGNDGDEGKDEDRDSPVILLTAPTGRAASILKRRTGLKARTLHSVLGTARKSNPEEFIYDKVEILVVDECSLVPISILSEVLSTLLGYSLKKVIFLGDPHQLPSIDPGNFLKDIIKAFQTTNPNFIQTLKENHRTDEGGKLIVGNARKIAEERRSDLKYEPDRFEMIDTSDCEAGKGQQQILDRLIRTKRQLQDHKKSQIVAFKNVDVENINKVCCQYYARHATFMPGRHHSHHIGDKICAKKNSTIRILGRSNPKDKDKKKQEAEGSEVKVDNQRQREGEAGPSKKKEKKGKETYHISNGDTFFIKNLREVVENDGKKKEIATLQSMDEEEGTLFDVDFKEMRSRSKIRYAWARTINTYQGSEVDYIVYVISPNCFYETWQHLYTAITRGCKGCIIVGTPARLQKVVKTDPNPRHTSLARFLRENLCEPMISRPNLGVVNPRTPVSSKRAREFSPYQGPRAQEQPVRGSPFHLPLSSNPATPVRSPYQQSQWGRQEVPVNKSLSNGPSTSSATSVQSLARLNVTAHKRAVPVPGCTPLAADLPGRMSSAADLPACKALAVASPGCKASEVASPGYKTSPVASPGYTPSAVDRPGSKPLARQNEMASLLNVVSLTAPARAVPVPGCIPSAADLPGWTSLAPDLPACKASSAAASGCKALALASPGCETSPVAPAGDEASAVVSPGCTSSAVDRPGSKPLAVYFPGNKPLAEVDTPSEVKAKPNRGKLSRKRKVKNTVPVNQDVPCLQGDDRTVTMDSEVPKKKSCASKPSLAVSPMAVPEQEPLDKNQVSASNGTEQAKRTSSPQLREGDSLFTSILPKEESTPVVPSRKSGFTFSRKRLKLARVTENKDFQNMSKGVKVETLPDGQGSPETSHGYGKENHNEPFRGSRGKMDGKESLKGFRSPSDSRAPLKSLALISYAVLKSVLSKSPQGEENNQSPSVLKSKDVQENTPRVQPKQQSIGNSQETLICVPGLLVGRYKNVRRIYSQESEELPSSPSRKSNESKEECPFEDSNDQELSQFLLQPPSALQVHPLFRGLEEYQKEDDDETDCSISSDETAFSSSGSSPCLGTGDYPSDGNDDDDGGGDAQDNVFEDDDDEEMSEFIFQHPNEIESW